MKYRSESAPITKNRENLELDKKSNEAPPQKKIILDSPKVVNRIRESY